MVLEKRLNYGFKGYQVPATPRATRSARRTSFRKKVQDNQQCAFDLLAAVAGKLLLEGASFPTTGKASSGKQQCDIYESTGKKEQKDEGSPQKIEFCDQRSCKSSSLGIELGSQAHNQNYSSKEFICTQNNAFSGLASILTSDCSDRVGCAENLLLGKCKSEVGSCLTKEEVGLSGHGESSYLDQKDEPNKHAKVELLYTGKALVSSGVDQCSADDPVILNGKSPALVNSASTAKVPSCRDGIPCGSIPAYREDVKLGVRDDDENFSGCSQPSTTTKTLRQPSHIVNRRFRKLLASKYWKLHPTSRNGDVSNIDGELKPVYCNRKTCYKRPRSQRIYPFKKRKLYACSSASSSAVGTSYDGIFSSSRKGILGDASISHAAILGVTETASSVEGQHTSCQSRDSHVKLRIKSFKVPELFIDIPVTATVGSLKRTVMEAVTAILGGGLHVGVLLRGKKVRDDNRTLLQTGISHDNKLDALGFSLEPNPSQVPTPLGPEDHPSSVPCDPPQPLQRYTPIGAVVHEEASELSPDPPLTNLGNSIESDHDSAPSPTDMPMDKSATDTQALVAIPATSSEVLAVVPMHWKSKQSEIVHRRIRRPFSVSEVEALVQAVEKLGTGRWRDVKLRAFDNAKYRTYVDLKDKWKTLVHTATISPQQRRGEPVPQELLDRVINAHAYWSQQQSKQQIKQQEQQPPETRLLL